MSTANNKTQATKPKGGSKGPKAQDWFTEFLDRKKGKHQKKLERIDELKKLDTITKDQQKLIDRASEHQEQLKYFKDIEKFYRSAHTESNPTQQSQVNVEELKAEITSKIVQDVVKLSFVGHLFKCEKAVQDFNSKKTGLVKSVGDKFATGVNSLWACLNSHQQTGTHAEKLQNAQTELTNYLNRSNLLSTTAQSQYNVVADAVGLVAADASCFEIGHTCHKAPAPVVEAPKVSEPVAEPTKQVVAEPVPVQQTEFKLVKSVKSVKSSRKQSKRDRLDSEFNADDSSSSQTQPAQVPQPTTDITKGTGLIGMSEGVPTLKVKQGEWISAGPKKDTRRGRGRGRNGHWKDRKEQRGQPAEDWEKKPHRGHRGGRGGRPWRGGKGARGGEHKEQVHVETEN